MVLSRNHTSTRALMQKNSLDVSASTQYTIHAGLHLRAEVSSSDIPADTQSPYGNLTKGGFQSQV